MPLPAPRSDWTAAQALSARMQAPLVDLERLCPEERPILVLAPHPDDETLGCGGLIALAAAAGREVTVVTLTDGAGSHPGSASHPPHRLAALRRAEAEAAVHLLSGGRAKYRAFDAPDGRLRDHEAEACGRLERELGQASLVGGSIFATWAADPHPDHQAAFRIAQRHASRLGARLFAYPVWGLILPGEAQAGEVAPWLRIDITEALARKRDAISLHRSQTGDLIDDDPDGFRLSSADIARHTAPFESFLSYDTYFSR